ncbi:MAG: HlyD family efflux transporter periplasmic adaptor subunit [Clostridia bacterium]
MGKIYRICVICLVFLTSLVIATNLTKYVFTREVEYTSALEITTYDDIESYGIFLRDEYIVENEFDSYVHIDITNGSRVKKGQDIGIIYNDRAYLEESMEISELRDKLAVINNVATITQTMSDSLKTAVQINASIAEFNQNLDPNDLSTVSYNLSEIENIALKSAYSQMTKAELADEIEILENQIAQKQLKISGDMQTVTADVTGLFIETIDSYENISEVTVDTIKEVVDAGNQNYADNEQIGKIITSHEWEFACVVDNDYVDAILKATKPRLIFESMPSNEISVTVSEVIKEDEQSVVIFAGKATNETILEMRSSNVQIVLKSYNGIKIPKQSAVVVDGVLGIYTLSGNQSSFKEIVPIFEKENYYVINITSQATNKDIIIGDKIITNSSVFSKTQFMN